MDGRLVRAGDLRPGEFYQIVSETSPTSTTQIPTPKSAAT